MIDAIPKYFVLISQGVLAQAFNTVSRWLVKEALFEMMIPTPERYEAT